jgi:hypothetical protein
LNQPCRDSGIPRVSQPAGPGISVSAEARTLRESSLEAPDSGSIDATVLERPGFDLDTAVFLAEASSAAYSASDKIDDWARAAGFEKSTFFDSGDVQGFWCASQESALLVFRGTSNPGQWLRDVRFLPAPYSWGHVHVGFRDGVAAVEVSLAAFDAVARNVPHVWVKVVTETVIAGGAAQEAAAAVRSAGISSPLLTDTDPMSLSQLEFDQLQLALGAGAESPTLEGVLPWFSDHAIGEYIRLLSDIREQSQTPPKPTQ